MAKNYESESKNSRNYTDTTSKNSYGNEMNHTDNARSKNETDSRDKAKNKMKNKTSQSYSSEEDRYYVKRIFAIRFRNAILCRMLDDLVIKIRI